MTKTVKAAYTCECGEKFLFFWDIDNHPDEQDALCPECEAVVFRPPIRPPVNSGWKQFKDEEPKDGQRVWLHTNTIFAPDVEYSTYLGKNWRYSEGKDQVSPEDYWMPFSYPAKPS